MPTKTATRQKRTENIGKTPKPDDGVTNGANKTASKNLKQSSNGVTETVDRKEAQAEYKERRKHQLDSVKNLDKELLREMLYQMVLGRVFEQKCAELYRIGKIGGFCHLYIGQEAISIGAQMALKKGDYVITSYRDHVQAMVAGISPEAVMAELYGKEGGVVKGKGGSMHMFSKEHNFFGGHGIVGGQIGVGTGMAYAQKYKGTDNVTLCFFGEAALNQGMFHESLNMAQLWKLPCIFICENNQYGMGTSQKRAMSLANIAKKAEAYGMIGEFVDGMDVMAVREATERAIERARKDGSPTLLEIRAYRFMGHSMSDPGKYRTTEEIKKYQERDPIVLFKDSLKEAKVFTDKDFEEVENRAKEATQKAVDFAESSPFPDEKELFTDILA
ncbi:MAG: pyruvate dehydrogenase (acetyl-transferring) E1 component subunit alpha [Acidobacteriota bacterium]|nr:pyruvate dehydrogenase (acetyl-transferring) E1 component subunit alpha [Acidobacteriota bacterium]